MRALACESISAYWLPDSTTPARVSEAIGVLYREIDGQDGNVPIEMGHSSLTGRLRDAYRVEPRDVRLLPDRIELTTAMPKPEDPRIPGRHTSAVGVASVMVAGAEALGVLLVRRGMMSDFL
jgi:hypothetical protein